LGEFTPEKGFSYRVSVLYRSYTALSLVQSVRKPKYRTLTRMRAMPKWRYQKASIIGLARSNQIHSLNSRSVTPQP